MKNNEPYFAIYPIEKSPCFRLVCDICGQPAAYATVTDEYCKPATFRCNRHLELPK